MQFFRKIKLLPLAFLFYKINQFINGCTIGSGASFGRGFVLAHPLGVVIHGKVVGGKNIMIQSGVVIGAKWSGLPKKVPVLGNNISIGSGAKILGGIKIGNNVNIGANAVVLKDVPDNVTVAGIPARIVKRR
jgi:serine O-acetyltransferase